MPNEHFLASSNLKIEKEKCKTGRLCSLSSTYLNHPKPLGNPFLITRGTFVSYIWAPDFIQFSTTEYYAHVSILSTCFKSYYLLSESNPNYFLFLCH